MAIFDKEAMDYDEWYKCKMGAFVDKVETQLAFSLFKPKVASKILDVGCGTGNFSIKLAEMGCKVVGIDVSEEMLSVAKKKAEEKGLDIEFHKMDVYNLKFPNKEFDEVFSMAAFEFIIKADKAYAEMYRVLKDKGHLLIGTINKDSKWGELYLSRSVRENSVFKHADFKTMEDLKSLNANEIIGEGECLFIPPDTREEDINMEFEEKLKLSERGGFICVLWQKGK